MSKKCHFKLSTMSHSVVFLFHRWQYYVLDDFGLYISLLGKLADIYPTRNHGKVTEQK